MQNVSAYHPEQSGFRPEIDSAMVNGVTAATNDVGLVTLPNGRHLAIAQVTRTVWDEWSK
jgi:hypothetical protein